MEPASGFEPGPCGLVIQHPSDQGITFKDSTKHLEPLQTISKAILFKCYYLQFYRISEVLSNFCKISDKKSLRKSFLSEKVFMRSCVFKSDTQIGTESTTYLVLVNNVCNILNFTKFRESMLQQKYTRNLIVVRIFEDLLIVTEKRMVNFKIIGKCMVRKY